MEVELTEDGNLSITMANDGKGYGSVRLEKFSAIAYHPECLEVTLVGKNTGAEIMIRFIEGSSEIWGYTITDDFTGERTFTVDVSDLSIMYGEQDGVFDAQKIRYVELMLKYSGELTIEVDNVRFVERA